MLQDKLIAIFGANWRTSTFGTLSVITVTLAGIVHTSPELLDFLPPTVSKYIAGISGIIGAVTGILFALSSKDKQVTGGTTTNTDFFNKPTSQTPPAPATPEKKVE